MNPTEHLAIPEFKNFITKPNNPTCVTIDSTRLMVEILGGLHPAPAEFQDSSYASKLLIEGAYALVFRYKREKDGSYRPTCSIGFDTTASGGIHIRQFQGSNDKKVAFRFNSSFNIQDYIIKILEESFVKKGIPVTVERFPTGIEGAADVHQVSRKYESLRHNVVALNMKYNLSTASSHTNDTTEL